jgi:hypothetical protein
MGLVQGTCDGCGKTIRRCSPVPLVVTCDCHCQCPLCGASMEPYAPDLDPRIYRDEDSQTLDPLGFAVKREESTAAVYVCRKHNPPFFSSRLPFEVLLE